jgi:hypothetical protein
MPRTLPMTAALPKLPELVAGMTPGDEAAFTANGEPVAVVTRPPRTSCPCQPGTAKDRNFWIVPDFDAPAGGLHFSPLSDSLSFSNSISASMRPALAMWSICGSSKPSWIERAVITSRRRRAATR